MRSDEIRETYLSYFEQRDHLRRPSASLVPAAHDPSVLLTTAGMQPFKPYFLGLEEPPAPRLTSCQRCFRTTDIGEVGNTARHLTFFEMLGNFSIGDYFKEEALGFGWELSTQGFGFDPDQIWVTVFAGDGELGLGPDEESIDIWRGLGVPDERIVRLPRSENFWQAGPTGPCGPCSEMYLDRGVELGAEDDRPGDDTDRFLEYWNHVLMTYELGADGSLTELPSRNIDTGLGLERMAAIQQDVPSVFDTDGFRPLVALAEELSDRSYGDGGRVTRAMRIIADHSRGMAQLLADGVVPSNEDRGYILRRIMRRAIQQGRVLEIEGPFLTAFADRVIELMSDAYPHLHDERETIGRWVEAEETGFGHTLDRGTELLERLIADAGAEGAGAIPAEEAFRLHDTYGFPFELTAELLAEQGLETDEAGFEELMSAQRDRARAGSGGGGEDDGARVAALAGAADASRFVGYEELETTTSVAAVEAEPDGATALVKLEESPFYAEGGGQVSDSGRVRWNGSEADVVGVVRVGDDQVVRIGAAGDGASAVPAIEPGTRVEAVVDRRSRHATMRNHTATHLLHAALRERLGTHVRQAGSAVRPDKLRFDFAHGSPLEPDDLAFIDERINGWIKDSLAVCAMEMDRAEAERLGAMALFGEKYGDWVRVVEVSGVSRELCGGTHVANTAEIGMFVVVSEGSSASNVRRIEAVTGPAAIDLVTERESLVRRAGELLGSPDDLLAGAERAARRLAELERTAERAGATRAGELADELAAATESVGELAVVIGRADEIQDPKELLDLADRVKAKVGGDAAVVLGSAGEEKVALVASFADQAVASGLSAAEVIKSAAALVGGGGGGRDNAAQAGGRDPGKLDEALEAARSAIAAGAG